MLGSVTIITKIDIFETADQSECKAEPIVHFSLRQIAVFDAIVRVGSLSGAAREVALSQSAASMALKELEENLGSKLFHRHGRKLILNENGRRLQPKAHSLMLLAAEIRKPETEELEGMLRVAASATVGNYALPNVLLHSSIVTPKCRLRLLQAAFLRPSHEWRRCQSTSA